MEPIKVFTPRSDPVTQRTYLDINQNLNKNERKAASLIVSQSATERRLLSSAELEANQCFEPESDKIYWFQFPNGDIPAFLHVSEDWLHAHEYREKILPIRKFLLNKDVQQRFADICQEHTSGYAGKHGEVYESGVSFQPGYGPGRAQLCPLTRAATESMGDRWNTQLIDLTNRIAEDWFGNTREGGLKQYMSQNASILPGTRTTTNRQRFTSCQVNYARPERGLLSLKKFGDVHPDMHDHPAFLTGMFDLSHFGPDHFGGRFNILPFRASVSMKGCSLTFFSARFYHCATGYGQYTVDEDSPFRQPRIPLDEKSHLDPETHPYMRLTIPMYPDRRMLEPSFRWFNLEMYGPEALNLFHHREQHYLWMLSLYILQEPAILSQLGNYDDADILGTFGKGPQRLIEATQRDIVETAEKRRKRRARQAETRKNGPKRISKVVPAGYESDSSSTEKSEDEKENFQMAKRKSRPVKGEKQTITDQREEVYGITRNGSPKFYAWLFSWEGMRVGFMKELTKKAMEMIADLNAPNPEVNSMMADLDTLDCGSVIKSDMVKASTPSNAPKWEAPTLYIPGNPTYDCTETRHLLRGQAAAAAAIIKLEQEKAIEHQAAEDAHTAVNVLEATFLEELVKADLIKFAESEGLELPKDARKPEIIAILLEHLNGDLDRHVEALHAEF